MFLHVQAIAFNMPKPDLKNGIPIRDELHESDESLAAPNILEVAVNPSSLANCSA